MIRYRTIDSRLIIWAAIRGWVLRHSANVIYPLYYYRCEKKIALVARGNGWMVLSSAPLGALAKDVYVCVCKKSGSKKEKRKSS